MAFLSNHAHLLLEVVDAKQLADFMGFVKSKIAREVGRRLRWREKIWGRRCASIVVSDEPEAQIARLRYLLAQGVKEHLVARCVDWPGVHAAEALITGRSLVGDWFDRTAEYRARQRGEDFGVYTFATLEALSFDPLPCWRHLEIADYQHRVADLVAMIEAEAKGEPRPADAVILVEPRTGIFGRDLRAAASAVGRGVSGPCVVIRWLPGLLILLFRLGGTYGAELPYDDLRKISRKERNPCEGRSMPTHAPAPHPPWLSRRFVSISVAVFLALGAGSPASADDLDSSRLEQITARMESLRDELVAVRRDLHRHPEVSGQEARTARVIAERLRKLGLSVRTDVGGHGVVAVVTGGRPGPLVAVRADIDAVYSRDRDPVPFRSETPGVRHICGHDIHTTVVLALAEGLVAVQDHLPGSVALVFQPAEESAIGARAMLADGLLDSISSGGMRPKAFFALHTGPFEVGRIGSRPGRLLAGRDRTTITLRGDGDLDAAATRVASGLGRLSTITFAQALRSTSEAFVLADVADSRTGATGERTIQGVLTMSDDRRSGVRSALARIVQAERDRGLDVDFDYQAGWVPGVWNDPELEARARQIVGATLGDGALEPIQGIIPMFSEDFGAFLEEIRGVMLFLGVSNAEKGIVGMPHSPGYVADEESIFVGARVLAALVLDTLDAKR